jgi:hypothetical protein
MVSGDTKFGTRDNNSVDQVHVLLTEGSFITERRRRNKVHKKATQITESRKEKLR